MHSYVGHIEKFKFYLVHDGKFSRGFFRIVV